MNRWLSPQKAARLAELAAKEAGRKRKEKLKSILMLAGVVVLMFVTYAAWLVITARLRHYRHHHHDKKPPGQSRTNRAAFFVPDGPGTFAKVEFETQPVRR